MTADYKIEISGSPSDLFLQHRTLFTVGALDFLVELFIAFDNRISKIYYDRYIKKYELKKSQRLPKFTESIPRNNKVWQIRPVPERLQNRRLDLGDVSPSNSDHFFKALDAEVQGIQVDFDDGHCPTWRNQIIGLYNVYSVVHRTNKQFKPLSKLPILMLRPRAWNMTEHNIMVNGKKLPGALVDFAILMYHNASILDTEKSGPCFYLSKLESTNEARLWNDIFTWTEDKLKLPYGSIKACVLIENILSSFEMEEILYELKDHSLGLNCGIWDYAASIIVKFGDRKNFLLPDRNKYVNMQKHFLRKYMELVVRICHSRGAHATGGMAAQLLTDESDQETIGNVVAAKRYEIEIGVDGFMVYDIKLVPYINQLWDNVSKKRVNQISFVPNYKVTEEDLLQIPTGGVTKIGLMHNIEVSILFIYNWLHGIGHFINKGVVEDSATAEISSSQIWQWIKHRAQIEDDNAVVTSELIYKLTENYLTTKIDNISDKINMILSARIFFDLVNSVDLPDFITTYLNDHYVFRQRHEPTFLSKTLKHKL